MIDSMLSKCEKNDSFCIRCFGLSWSKILFVQDEACKLAYDLKSAKQGRRKLLGLDVQVLLFLFLLYFSYIVFWFVLCFASF